MHGNEECIEKHHLTAELCFQKGPTLKIKEEITCKVLQEDF